MLIDNALFVYQSSKIACAEPVINIYNTLEAPVKKGTVAGSLDVILDGEKLVSVELITGEPANRLKLPALLWRSLADWISRLWNRIFH